MTTLTKTYIEKNIPMLGFGIMRLPTLGDKTIDMPRFIEMVDHYMSNGMNYFDTAYMYHNNLSENAVKTAVVDRYPREAFKIATKLPIWSCEAPSDMNRIFNEQLERLGVDYVDFYMFHAMNTANDLKVIEFGGYEFIKELKAQGKVRHIGISFHGNAESLDKMFRENPELEFAQLQINYVDWQGSAKEFYDITKKHGKQVIIMEPVRGGALSNLPKELEGRLKAADPAASIASWALRWCGTLEADERGVMTTLSGMSTERQMEENVELFKNFKPLTPKETEMLAQVAEGLRKYPKIDCTECKYCNCPIEIPIADIFKQYNRFVQRKNVGSFKNEYNKFTKRGDACAECGKCEAICPQGVKVVEQLRYVDKTFTEL